MTNLTNIDLTTLTLKDLQTLAKEFQVKNWWKMKKAELISSLEGSRILQQKAQATAEKNLKEGEEYCPSCGAKKMKGFLCPECGKELPKTSKKKMTPMPGTEDPNWGKKAAGKKTPTQKDKAPKVEKNEENLITLKELASEFHMKGTKARRLLRNNEAARPFSGNRWEWDKELHSKELDKAREILEAHSTPKTK